MTCKLCNKDVSVAGGALTNHLKKDHNISLEDYVVMFDYDGVAPICKCGWCDSRPYFHRGSFSEYAKGHNSFKHKKEQYIKRHGKPSCKECGKEVSFYRGEPRSFCSFKCSGKNAGFSLQKTQDKIREVVIEKYGVDNVSYLDSVKEKISKANTGTLLGKKLSLSRRAKISKEMKRRWKDPKYRKKILSRAIPNRFSQLHLSIVDKLSLRNLGFKGEQVVGSRYLVDELHEDKKIVIEINGDYTHANPKFYKAADVINMPGNSYTAQEKWESDKRKKEYLESEGYHLIVIWESDDLPQKLKEIKKLL